MMQFKKWVVESIDQNTEKSLLQQKHVEPNALQKFINMLKMDQQHFDTKTAFVQLNKQFPKNKQQNNTIDTAPTDPFILNYHQQLINKQITKPEYNTLLFFKDQNQQMLTEMMNKLREFIQNKKIILNFRGEPIIILNGKENKFNNFTKLMSMIHSFEENKKNSKFADPALLEFSHDHALITKGNNIWVFKGNDPIDCRKFGKGQTWCISSSSSAQYYFQYRYDHKQTQYFIFDFNKAENDPARYVNPGIAPEGEYSEWVDSRNTHHADPDDDENEVGINGYKSIAEYKKYLASQGVDVGKLIAHPLSIEEIRFYNKYKNGLSDNDFIELTDEEKSRYIDIFNHTLTNVQFSNLSNDLKIKYIEHEHGLTNWQVTLLNDKLMKLYEKVTIEKIKDNNDEDLELEASEWLIFIKNNNIFDFNKLSYKDINNLIKYSKNKDEMFKLILDRKKNLTDNDIQNLIKYSTNKDELIKLIINNKENLSDINYCDIFRHSTNGGDETAKLIINNKENLSDGDIDGILFYSINKDEIAKLIINKKELSKSNAYDILYYSINKDEIAQLIINNNPSLSDAVAELLNKFKYKK